MATRIAQTSQLVRTAALALCCSLVGLATACFDLSADPQFTPDGGATFDAEVRADGAGDGAPLDTGSPDSLADAGATDSATDGALSADASAFDSSANDAATVDASADASTLDALINDVQVIDVVVDDVVPTQLRSAESQ